MSTTTYRHSHRDKNLQKTGTAQFYSEEFDVDERCTELLVLASNAQKARACLSEAKNLADRYPEEHNANLTYALILERCRLAEGMLEHWLAMDERFPDCLVTQRYCVRWYRRGHRIEDAQAYIGDKSDSKITCEEDAIHIAQLHMELDQLDKADEIFESAIRAFPQGMRARIVYSRNLKLRGRVKQAWRVVEPIAEAPKLPPSGERLVAELTRAVEVLDHKTPVDWDSGESDRILALRLAIESFECREVPLNSLSEMGGLTLLTGSLGAGGAERQMVNTAVNLEKLRRQEANVDGVEICRQIDVIVTSLNASEGKDFYLDMALSGGVPVTEMQNISPKDLVEICQGSAELSALAPVLPQNCQFGLQRLVDHFRDQGTEIAYLWQDGAVLIGALSALIAGVPRIVINLRGLPPNLRPHLYREEYEEMYKALARVPGISFVTNGAAVSLEYSKWLNLPLERFTVIPNGVVPPKLTPNAVDEEEWNSFCHRTQEHSETIGGVFRFETDKRPMLWILFARQYLKQNPKAQFVLVGGGKMLNAAKERALKLGIADRILFVGESDNVGYWFDKMDIFVLLSRFEGLPNVLIEAQMCGVPVVSTPAGSAEDTFLNGETGFLLPDVENPDIDEIVEGVELVSNTMAGRPEICARASDRAMEIFSVSSMIKGTVSHLVLY